MKVYLNLFLKKKKTINDVDITDKYLLRSADILEGNDKEKRLELVNEFINKLDTRFATWIDYGDVQIKTGFYDALIKNLNDNSNKNEFVLLRIMTENNPTIFNETKTKHAKLISSFLLTNMREEYYDSDMGKYESMKSSKERSIYEILGPKEMDFNFRREVVDIKRKFGEEKISNTDLEKIRAIKAFSLDQQTANMMLATDGFCDTLFHLSDLEPEIVENYIKFVNCLPNKQKIAMNFSQEEWNEKILATFVPIETHQYYFLPAIFFTFAYSTFRNSLYYFPRMGFNHLAARSVTKGIGYSMLGIFSFIGIMKVLKNNEFIFNDYHFGNGIKTVFFLSVLYSLYKFAPYSALPSIFYYFLDIEKSSDEVYKKLTTLIKSE